MDTTKYRDALVAEKSKLEAELGSVSQRNPQNPGDWDTKAETRDDNRADENDNADVLEELVNDEAIVRQLESQLVEVNAALGRMEAGTYGTCETCGAEIEADRLEANPAARTCKAHMN
jgi:DnaK suppressor protein